MYTVIAAVIIAASILHFARSVRHAIEDMGDMLNDDTAKNELLRKASEAVKTLERMENERKQQREKYLAQRNKNSNHKHKYN